MIQTLPKKSILNLFFCISKGNMSFSNLLRLKPKLKNYYLKKVPSAPVQWRRKLRDKQSMIETDSNKIEAYNFNRAHRSCADWRSFDEQFADIGSANYDIYKRPIATRGNSSVGIPSLKKKKVFLENLRFKQHYLPILSFLLTSSGYNATNKHCHGFTLSNQSNNLTKLETLALARQRASALVKPAFEEHTSTFHDQQSSTQTFKKPLLGFHLKRNQLRVGPIGCNQQQAMISMDLPSVWSRKVCYAHSGDSCHLSMPFHPLALARQRASALRVFHRRVSSCLPQSRGWGGFRPMIQPRMPCSDINRTVPSFTEPKVVYPSENLRAMSVTTSPWSANCTEACSAPSGGRIHLNMMPSGWPLCALVLVICRSSAWDKAKPESVPLREIISYTGSCGGTLSGNKSTPWRLRASAQAPSGSLHLAALESLRWSDPCLAQAPLMIYVARYCSSSIRVARPAIPRETSCFRSVVFTTDLQVRNLQSIPLAYVIPDPARSEYPLCFTICTKMDPCTCITLESPRELIAATHMCAERFTQFRWCLHTGVQAPGAQWWLYSTTVEIKWCLYQAPGPRVHRHSICKPQCRVIANSTRLRCVIYNSSRIMGSCHGISRIIRTMLGIIQIYVPELFQHPSVQGAGEGRGPICCPICLGRANFEPLQLYQGNLGHIPWDRTKFGYFRSDNRKRLNLKPIRCRPDFKLEIGNYGVFARNFSGVRSSVARDSPQRDFLRLVAWLENHSKNTSSFTAQNSTNDVVLGSYKRSMFAEQTEISWTKLSVSTHFDHAQGRSALRLPLGRAGCLQGYLHTSVQARVAANRACALARKRQGPECINKVGLEEGGCLHTGVQAPGPREHSDELSNRRPISSPKASMATFLDSNIAQLQFRWLLATYYTCQRSASWPSAKFVELGQAGYLSQRSHVIFEALLSAISGPCPMASMLSYNYVIQRLTKQSRLSQLYSATLNTQNLSTQRCFTPKTHLYHIETQLFKTYKFDRLGSRTLPLICEINRCNLSVQLNCASFQVKWACAVRHFVETMLKQNPFTVYQHRHLMQSVQLLGLGKFSRCVLRFIKTRETVSPHNGDDSDKTPVLAHQCSSTQQLHSSPQSDANFGSQVQATNQCNRAALSSNHTTEELRQTSVEFYGSQKAQVFTSKSYTHLIPIKFSIHYYSALFFADEIVKFLKQNKPFRQIWDKVIENFKRLKEIAQRRIKGIRISCSGRTSKKAAKAKTISAKYGRTSLHVFSAEIDFASKTANTRFGAIGVKIWLAWERRSRNPRPVVQTSTSRPLRR